MIKFWTIFSREVARFLKVIVQTVVTPVVSSVFYLIVFGVSLGDQIGAQNGAAYLAFLIPGLMTMGLMNNAFQNSSSSISVAKFTGELEDWKIAPLTSAQIIWAIGFGAVIRGTVVAVMIFIVGSLFHWFEYNGLVPIEHPILLIFFVICGGLVFGNLGIAGAFWAKTFDQMSAVSAFILLPLTYLGGVFVSIERLSPFWQKVSQLNPLFYFINGVRYSMLGQADIGIERSIVVCLVSLVVLHFVAKFSFRRGSFHRW